MHAYQILPEFSSTAQAKAYHACLGSHDDKALRILHTVLVSMSCVGSNQNSVALEEELELLTPILA